MVRIIKKDMIKRTLIKFDKWCNYQLRKPLNNCLRKEGGYDFGNPYETISSALGKNMMDKTLTNFGWFICAIVEFYDTLYWLLSFKPRPYRDHCISSIQEFRSPYYRFRTGDTYEARAERGGEATGIIKSDPPKDPPQEGGSTPAPKV